MSKSIGTLFTLYQLTPGRRIYALRRVRPLALAAGHERIVEAIDDAITHDREVIELDARRRRGPRPTPPAVRLHDSEVDRALQMIEQTLLHRASRDEGGPAAILHAEVFPDGLGPHVRLAHVEQITANERVLELLESEGHGKWLAAHGFTTLIADLRASHDAFVDAMALRDTLEIPTYQELRRQLLIGHELYLRVVSEIIVACFDEAQTLAELLGPIEDQNQEVRALRRRRRSVPDIDPDSGDPLLDDAEEEAQDDASPGVEGQDEGEQIPTDEADDSLTEMTG